MDSVVDDEDERSGPQNRSLLILALLILFAPGLSHAAPLAEQTVFVDDAGEGDVKRVVVRSRDRGKDSELLFTVKVSDLNADGLRLEWTDGAEWFSASLDRTGRNLFKATVAVHEDADVSFFLLGTGDGGRVEDFAYATLIEPARIVEPDRG